MATEPIRKSPKCLQALRALLLFVTALVVSIAFLSGDHPLSAVLFSLVGFGAGFLADPLLRHAAGRRDLPIDFESSRVRPTLAALFTLIGAAVAMAAPPQLAAGMAISCFGAVVMALADHAWGIVPTEIAWGTAALAGVALLISSPAAFLLHVSLAAALFGVVALISVLSRGGIGMGDGRMLTAIAIGFGSATLAIVLVGGVLALGRQLVRLTRRMAYERQVRMGVWYAVACLIATSLVKMLPLALWI